MRLLSLSGLAFLLLAACGKPDVEAPDECGPNAPCPTSQECSATTPRRCIESVSQSQGGDAAVPMPADAAPPPVDAPPPPVKLTLTVAGMGSVAPAGTVACGAAQCSYSLPAGGSVDLLATPAAGWRLVSWGGDCAGSSPVLAVTPTRDLGCSATFAAAEQAGYSVTVAAEAGGAVSAGSSLGCSGASCSGQIPTGATVTFTASTLAGYRWDGWRGSADCDGKDANPLTFAVSGEVMCRATFVQTFTVAAATAFPGAAVSVEAGSCHGASCVVDKGASATFTAATVAGSRFTGWTGGTACGGSQPTFAITVGGDTSCVAGYVRRVGVTGLPEGVTATSPDAHSQCDGATCAADSGAAVTLVAPSRDGFRLAGWTGCDGGVVSGSGITVHPTGDMTCTATYVAGLSVSGTVVGAVGEVTVSSPTAGAVCFQGTCGLEAGGSVTLTAPDLAPAYRFAGWSGDAGCAGGSLVLTLDGVSGSAACTASYVRRLRVSGSVDAGLTGNVTAASGDALAACAGNACTVDVGGAVTLTAPVIAGRRFTGWSGGCGGDGATVSVSPGDGDVACVASYVLRVRVATPVEGARVASSAPFAACDSGGCTVDAGSDVELTAPDREPGQRFLGWNGGCSGILRAIELAAVGADVTCGASYIDRVTVAAAVGGGVAGSATVTSADPTAACGAASCTIDAGQSVTITAPAVDGVRFVGWVGAGACDGATANPLTLTAGAPLTCTATYVERVTISAAASGAAAAPTVTGGGCHAASCVVDRGSSVTLDAPAAAGARFTGWSGDAPCAGGDAALTFAAEAATSCTAGYVARHTISGAVAAGLTGSVTATSSDGASSCAGASCVADEGKPVTLVAPTIAGYRLTGWSGCSGTSAGAGLTVTASADATCTAIYALGVSVSGTIVGASGAVSASSTSPGASCGSGSCVLDLGGSVTLVSDDLAPAYRFAGWSGGGGCAGSALSLTLSGVTTSVSCTATWVHRLTVTGAMPTSLAGSGSVAAASADPRASCAGSACTVDAGQSVALTAPAISGQRFTGWSGSGCGSGNPMTVAPLVDVTCTAVYARTVTVAATASGATPTLSAASTSPGASCAGATCALDSGGDVTLTSSDLAPAYRFTGWTGDSGCAASSLVATIAGVKANKTCDAGWVRRWRVSGSAPSGTVTASSSDPARSCTTSSCTVDAGQSVTLSAPDIGGYRFTGWSSGCGSSQTTVVTPTADTACTAQYVQRNTIGAVAGTGGTVATSCGAASCTVDAGTSVTLTATPSASYRFASWSGSGCSPTGDNPLTLVNVSATCTATFVRQYTIAALAGSGGTVKAKTGGQNCQGASCTVDAGVNVTLTPTPASNYRFGAWSGSGCTPSGNNPLVLHDVDATCSASFVRRYTIAASAGTGGSVTTSCGAASCTVDAGTAVTLTATPATSYRFAGWTGSGCAPAADDPLVLKDVDATCAASFVRQYTVAASAGTGGSVTTSCGAASCTVDAGTSVTLTATPSASYRFGGWTGAGCAPAGDDPLALTDVDATCTATFIRQYTIAAVAGAGGSVVAKTGGNACTNASCVVDPATNVRLTATADSAYRFAGWSGTGCAPTGDNPLILADLDATCTATFIRQYTVTAAADTGGSVSTSCGAASCTVDAGSSVTVTATASSNYRFSSWSGTGCMPKTDNPLVLTSVDATCTATFVRLYTIAALAGTGGSVVAKTGGVACSGASCTVEAGSIVRLIATPDASYRFGGWTGTGCGPATDNPLLLGDVDATCTATFIRQYTVTAAAGSGGSVSTSCGTASCTVDKGSSVTLTATADASYRFDKWSGAGCTPRSDDPLVLTDVDATCTATFIRRYTIAAAAGSGGTVATSCGAASCVVDAGSSVNLTATADGTHRFDAWTGTGCTPAASNPLSLSDVDATCTATFVRQYTISATAGSGGSVTAKTGGQLCSGASCTVDPAKIVKLEATASSGKHFVSWSGSGCAPATDNPLSLSDVDAACAASFAADATYTATGVASPTGAATITASAAAGTCAGATCTGLPSGTSVVFGESPASGYVMKSWSANCGGGSGSTTSVSVTADITCTASFKVTISGALSGSGSATIAGSTSEAGVTCSGTPSCVVTPGASVTFTVTAAAGTAVTGWSGPCTVTADPRVATLASAATPGTCTATTKLEWAVSVGDAQGSDDGAVAIGLPDDSSVNVLGTLGGGAPLWLPALAASSGEIMTPHVVSGSLGVARGLVQIGADAVILAARSTAPSAPVLARIGPTGLVAWSKSVGGSAAGESISGNTPSGLVLSADGNLRVGSNLDKAQSPTKLGRLTTLSQAGTASTDVRLCDAMGAAGCATCKDSTLGPIADAIGKSGTVVVVNSVPASSGFSVAFVKYDGTVTWTRKVAFDNVTVSASGAASMPDGSVVIVGKASEVGQAGTEDAFYLRFAPDGSGGFPGGVHGYLVGRAGAGEGLAAAVAGPNGVIAMTGLASDAATTAHKNDAWILVVDAAGAISKQVAYGSAEIDRGTAIAAVSGGYLVAGVTQGFGALASDMWVVRTDATDLDFAAGAGGHQRAVNAARGTPATVSTAACVQSQASPVTTAAFDNLSVDIKEPLFSRQAP